MKKIKTLIKSHVSQLGCSVLSNPDDIFTYIFGGSGRTVAVDGYYDLAVWHPIRRL